MQPAQDMAGVPLSSIPRDLLRPPFHAYRFKKAIPELHSDRNIKAGHMDRARANRADVFPGDQKGAMYLYESSACFKKLYLKFRQWDQRQ